MDPLPLSIIICVLLLLSAFFSGTETAYSCANAIKLKSMMSLGKKNAKAVHAFATEKYDKLVTAILVGNNIVNLSASALGTTLFAILLNNASYSDVVSTAVLTVAVLIVGEITPKYLASVYPEKFCFISYPLMQVFYWILIPLCKIFDGFKWLLTKIFKLKKDETVTDEELMSLVDEAEESGTLKEDESELLRSALEFDDLKVEDILVPRVSVSAVEENCTMDEVCDMFEKTGFSRLPVYRDTIDNVIGLIHQRDFFVGYVIGEKKFSHLVQDIVFTAEHMRISALLKQLQKQKVHMAAVLDEYGGLLGIVTLEDILEELVGEIWDEHDEEEVLFGKIDEGEYWVDAKCSLYDFLKLYDLESEDEEYESNTVGGWVTEKTDSIPEIGTTFVFENVEVKVVKATKQKVLKIRSKYLGETVSDEEENEKNDKNDKK
ncbi:MAG: HlyC/CorC family transporter [Clostridia bacterium]|nr:HlyC/CorC family transporter [Clostridia bacterium]